MSASGCNSQRQCSPEGGALDFETATVSWFGWRPFLRPGLIIA
jgi:hypothetical protein